MLTRRFDATEEAPAAARVLVREALAAEATDDIVSAVALLTSELVTNVVRHARTPLTVGISVSERRVRVDVSDGSAIIPAAADLLDPHVEGRRGLALVDRLSSRWGIDATTEGKTVWFEIDR
jgi:anti-sigma regulatory factor (Ser/Thr protein kinase)